MKKYELALVINGKLDEANKAEALEKVKGYVSRFGGTITDAAEWGKRRLAYEINHINEGFFYFIKFEANTDAPKEIEKRVRIMESVIRYLIVSDEN